jgi:hypothetical protein
MKNLIKSIIMNPNPDLVRETLTIFENESMRNMLKDMLKKYKVKNRKMYKILHKQYIELLRT